MITLRKLILPVIFTVVIFSHSSAEVLYSSLASGSISGKIVDYTSSHPMEYVNIALFTAKDSSFVTGTITDSTGRFEINKVNMGAYYLEASFMGYKKTRTVTFSLNPENRTIDLGQIQLSPTSEILKTYEVTAEKQRIEYKIDKRVINVDKDIIAKGGTAVNALENTPSVQVDAQGNVTLRGSSDYLVLIDGKPSPVKGSDALKQIPAGSIEKIEVITNPSARYDAEGQAGIINILLKKEKLQGLNGTINASAGTGDKYTSSAQLNFREKKINIFGGYEFARNKYISNIDVDTRYILENDDLIIASKLKQFFHNDNLTVNAGMDYTLDAKNTLSVSGSYGEQSYDQGGDSKYIQFKELQSFMFHKTSHIYNDIMGRVTTLTADYQHLYGENHSLSLSNYFFQWDGRDDNCMSVSSTNEYFEDPSLDSKLWFVKDNYNYQYRANLDYKRPLRKGSIEAGAQYRYEYRFDDLVFKTFNIDQQAWYYSTLFSNVSHYYNSIYSGYATYQNMFHGIGYQVGLRSEYFQRSIEISNEKKDYEYDKFMLYPSLHLSKDFGGKHQLQAGYSRRINRPVPYLLNNNPSYIDPNNIFKGSPLLKPEFTDAYELNYRFAAKIFSVFAQTYIRNTTNSFSAIRTLGDDGISYHELTNADRLSSYGIELGGDLSLAKWWQLSTGINLYHYSIEAEIAGTSENQSTDTWDARIVSNWSLPWGTRFQGSAYYRAPSVDVQGKVTDLYVINLAVSQVFMKGKANLSLVAQDIFKTSKFSYSYNNSRIRNLFVIQNEGQIFMLNFSYSFNNFEHKQRGRGDDSNFGGGRAF
ncbi:MAG: TonB-dependent receptor [Bacteroidales bacterium]